MLLLRWLRSRSVYFVTLAGIATCWLAPIEGNAQTVRISNISDVNTPIWQTGDPDIVQDVYVCIYRENTSGSVRTYSITATGDGPGYYLKNGSETLAYSVTWNDGGAGNLDGGTSSPMVNNIALTLLNSARIQTDAPTYSSDCNAGASPTGRVRITISSANLDAVYDGNYSGVLTFVLSPT